MFYLLSLANMRQESKFQQIVTSIGIVIISFVTVYMTPPRPMMMPESDVNIVKD